MANKSGPMSDKPLSERTLERAAQFVEAWANNYPRDVFIEPPPGKHGETIDACSARALRDMLPRVAKAIRELPPDSEVAALEAQLAATKEALCTCDSSVEVGYHYWSCPYRAALRKAAGE